MKLLQSFYAFIFSLYFILHDQTLFPLTNGCFMNSFLYILFITSSLFFQQTVAFFYECFDRCVFFCQFCDGPSFNDKDQQQDVLHKIRECTVSQNNHNQSIKITFFTFLQREKNLKWNTKSTRSNFYDQRTFLCLNAQLKCLTSISRLTEPSVLLQRYNVPIELLCGRAVGARIGASQFGAQQSRTLTCICVRVATCTFDRTKERKKKRNGKCKRRRLFNTETKRRRIRRPSTLRQAIKKNINGTRIPCACNLVRQYVLFWYLLIFMQIVLHSKLVDASACVCQYGHRFIRFEWDNQIFGTFFSFLHTIYFYVKQLHMQMKC